MLDILKFPDPHLFTKTDQVTVFGPELQTLLDAMWETMVANSGMGLAANQVGLSQRMFVMVGPDDKRINLVNPYIVASSVAFANFKEGCLSAPGDFVVIPDRASWVVVEYLNENGEQQPLKVFKDIYSVCCQHEIDHLDGKAYLENKSIPKNIRKTLAKKWGIKLK